MHRDITTELERFQNVIRSKYPDSKNTFRTYSSLMKRFLTEFPYNIKKATSAQLTEYLSKIESRATMAQTHGVLKNYFTHVLKQPGKVKFVPYPKKEQRLPQAPNHHEVLKMIDKTVNTKHKLIIMMLYATGIRLSELTGLQWKDISRTEDKEKPLMLHIRGKGKKDRMVPLSENVHNELIRYCRAYKLGCQCCEEDYLFGTDKPYTQHSVQRVVKAAGERVGIKVSPHILRHACFSHMRSKGVDLAVIQELAGHASIETTRIYAKLNPGNFDMPL